MFRENTNTKYFFFSSLITLALIISYLQFKPDKNLILRFYDIGQGDASLVTIPDNLRILIDGGPDSTILNKLGRDIGPLSRSFTFGILTHEHADHAAGFKEFLRYYRTNSLISPTDVSQFDIYSTIKRRVAVAGDKIVIPTYSHDVVLTVLWPPSEVFSKNCNLYCFIDPTDLNDTSLVFLLEYGNFKALYLGDVTNKVLETLPDVGVVNVVKVPHQGSVGSFLPEFYNKIKPEYAVIMVGQNNYGHPSMELVDFLKSLGTKVLITKDVGDVSFKVAGDGAVKVTPNRVNAN